jgi:hypothetical protein
MIPYLNDKIFNVTPPAAKVNTATAAVTNIVDTYGFAWLRVRLILGTIDIAATVWKLQMCDTSGGTYIDVPNSLASGTTGDGRLPQATDGNKIFDIMCNLKGLQRYVQPVLTIGTGSTGAFLCMIGELYFAEQTPPTTAAKGEAGLIVC